jgi:hypothetical protein
MEAEMNARTTYLAFGAAAGALLAATFAAVGVASADTWEITPDYNTFVPTSADGFPPLYDTLLGTENVVVTDVTTNTPFGAGEPGSDAHTTIGTFTNDDFLYTANAETFLVDDTNGVSTFTLAPGTEVDIANFGGGFENDWMNIPGTGVTDMLLTPFGDFNIPL